MIIRIAFLRRIKIVKIRKSDNKHDEEIISN
jgi:hypothetical protein